MDSRAGQPMVLGVLSTRSEYHVASQETDGRHRLSFVSPARALLHIYEPSLRTQMVKARGMAGPHSWILPALHRDNRDCTGVAGKLLSVAFSDSVWRKTPKKKIILGIRSHSDTSRLERQLISFS